MSLLISPFSLASKGGKDVARALGVRRIKPIDSQYRYRNGDRIINWGRSGPLPFPVHINQPEAVAKAINKRVAWDCFNHRGVPTVRYATSPEEVSGWLRDNFVVYARETLTGHGGRGIHVLSGSEDMEVLQRGLPSRICFTKGFPIHREFRVLVVADAVVLVSEKKKRNGSEHVPNEVRNHDNGWVFCRNDLEPIPSAVSEHSVNAVKALGLDFGAIDIAVDLSNNVCVFEVNTAPGVCGSSVPSLANALRTCVIG